jgi:hypothetical protein
LKEKSKNSTGNLSTIILTENDLEQQVDKFAEAIQSAFNRTFQTTNTEKKNRTKKSASWWTESLTIMRKRVNAHKEYTRELETMKNTGKGENKHT